LSGSGISWSSRRRALVEDDIVGLLSWRDSYDAESTTAGSWSIGSRDLVDTHSRWVNLARQSIAAGAFALDSNTPVWHDIAEWSSRLEPDWVPSELHEGVAVGIDVSTDGVRSPVTPWVRVCAPDTGGLAVESRVVDVVLSSSTGPVFGSWNSKCCGRCDFGWDQHGFVSGKDGLAERDDLAGQVSNANSVWTVVAVWLVGEWL
jgi:hypothetical protein